MLDTEGRGQTAPSRSGLQPPTSAVGEGRAEERGHGGDIREDKGKRTRGAEPRGEEPGMFLEGQQGAVGWGGAGP